ncbi:Peptidase [Mucilaginibacter pineti]|uniref:Peptidase n=1 Tax=Mucilaginibacter pineti TaxID=1391627 RepID=A0A1G6TBK3_9SPHI|nr:basic secretory protein-like protein [Mucilaginibacter pineti]SDD26512.1 Peptidase [Mucilaginibacter pineti]
MKKLSLLCTLFVLLLINASNAQQTDVYNKNGYKLTFINYDSTLDTALHTTMVNTFYKVYPVLVNAYNPESMKEVVFVIDTTYKGVAETGRGRVRISSHWMHQHPEDIDVITHEVMHIVQGYGGRSGGPGWLTEGIADYARYKYGINNDAAHWSLTPFKSTQSYTNSYRITARFLAWIENKVKPGVVKDFDGQLRAHAFTVDSWKTATGKTLDELWADYSANPVI